MDIETHSITLISIIVGLGLTEMFGNLHRLVRHRERVHWDVLPLVWAATVLLLVLNYWWALFLRLDGSGQARTAAEFGLLLAPPVLLFVIAASVLPHFEADGEWDMRRHYDAQRKVFILTFALYQLSTWTTAFVTGSFGWDYVSLVRLLILALLISMLFINSRRWDGIGVATIAAVLLVRLLTQTVR
jgi:hypothetical protein